MSGYVRIHRALCGHPAFRNDAEAMAFAWMIAKAAWRPTRVRYKERGVCLLRGQLAVSVRDFAKAMDRDKAWIERLLKRLKAETMIEVRHETGVNVITVCNYEQFQTEQDRRKTPDETRAETDARQGRDTEQVREEREEGIITPPTPRKRGESAGVCFPQDWQLPPASSLSPKAKACAELWSEASYETEGEGFALYWRQSRKRRPDWRATWCAWVIRQHSKVMRDQKFGNAPPAAKQEVTAGQFEERARFFESVGKTDEAADCRRRAAELERKAA